MLLKTFMFYKKLRQQIELNIDFFVLSLNFRQSFLFICLFGIQTF